MHDNSPSDTNLHRAGHYHPFRKISADAHQAYHHRKAVSGGGEPKRQQKGWEPDRFGFPPPVNINVSAVDFHFHKPLHSGFALELLHLLGILAAQFLDLLIIRLDAVKDCFGTQVVPAQRADACAHRA